MCLVLEPPTDINCSTTTKHFTQCLCKLAIVNCIQTHTNKQKPSENKSEMFAIYKTKLNKKKSGQVP